MQDIDAINPPLIGDAGRRILTTADKYLSLLDRMFYEGLPEARQLRQFSRRTKFTMCRCLQVLCAGQIILRYIPDPANDKRKVMLGKC